MKKMLLLLLFVLSLQIRANQLQKVFLHTLESDRSENAHIELAKLVFYFSQEPEIRTEQSKGSHVKRAQITFFFPDVATAQEVLSMIDAANNVKSEKYKFMIKEVAKPSKGVKLAIIFDPEKIMIKHDSFDAITRAKGVEFHIYNKQLLQELQNKGTNVLRTTYATKPFIIIDAGHGGSDIGTKGIGGLAEKNITLELSKKLEAELTNRGYQVCMTRTNDSFVSLDQRTRIANAKDNALFISLHGNNASNASVRGLETFCLDSKLFKSVNNELATAIDVIIQSADEQKNKASKKLAELVHREILAEFKAEKIPLPDRKVKYAASQVLMGTKCPSILIEVDFISHPEVEKNLQTSKCQNLYVNGICKGLEKYGA